MGTGWTREMCWRSGGGEVTTILSNRKSERMRKWKVSWSHVILLQFPCRGIWCSLLSNSILSFLSLTSKTDETTLPTDNFSNILLNTLEIIE